jgi:hypothetical protein
MDFKKEENKNISGKIERRKQNVIRDNFVTKGDTSLAGFKISMDFLDVGLARGMSYSPSTKATK